LFETPASMGMTKEEGLFSGGGDFVCKKEAAALAGKQQKSRREKKWCAVTGAQKGITQRAQRKSPMAAAKKKIIKKRQ